MLLALYSTGAPVVSPTLGDQARRARFARIWYFILAFSFKCGEGGRSGYRGKLLRE